MVARWIWWINYGLGGLAGLLLLVALTLKIFSHSAIQEPPLQEIPKNIEKELPRSSLKIGQEAHDTIGQPLLTTKVVLPQLTLPDLRPVLTYYGTNSRPDSATDQTRLQFGLTGNQGFAAIAANEPLYLLYDRSQNPGRYILSPENLPTGLWIQATPKDTEAIIKVFLRDDEGKIITEPKVRSEFNLQEKEFARFGGGNWEIGKQRVDGTLLARQRARWYGQDLFFNEHGGEEYAAYVDKERIEFGEGEDRYVVYVGGNDCLIWDGKRWQQARSVSNSTTYPLLCIKKVEDRLMRLDLWDTEGKGRVAINLLKSTEAWAPQVIQRDFKFISVRTLSQYVFDIRKDRVVLRPGDWLLQTKDGWKKLVSTEDIDAFVDGKAQGVLFIFNGVGKKAEGQVISGTLYNATRSTVFPVEIPVEHSGNVLNSPQKEAQKAAEVPPSTPPPTSLPPPQTPSPSAPIAPPPGVENRVENREAADDRATFVGLEMSVLGPVTSKKLETARSPVRPLGRRARGELIDE